MQLSGSGLVAPCGMLFNDKYKKFHIGDLNKNSFKEIYQSDRYGEVMAMLADSEFDARTDCGFLCLQHKTNEILNELKRSYNKGDDLSAETLPPPPAHLNFI